MAGDAVVDIESGKAANVAMTIGITHGFGEQEALERANPDFIVHSLAEISALVINSVVLKQA